MTPSRLQKHLSPHLFRVWHEVDLIQRAFQLAFKALHMSGSEMERLKIGRVWKGVKIQNMLLDLIPIVSSLISQL